MKNFTMAIVLFLFMSSALMAQTIGNLTVTTTTSETGGNYAPRNIVAIWIENEQGDFVKTLMAYAANRKTHLNTWQATTAAAGTEFNVTDAITGATRTSHATRECTWDGTHFNGQEVPDGNYYVWMELTDKNNTGNYSSFMFTKGDVAETLTPSNVPSFANITIDWNPTGPSSVTQFDLVDLSIDPNPGNGIYTIKAEQMQEAEVRKITGELVLKTTSENINISQQDNGIYLVIVKTDKGKAIKKIVKN